MLGIPTDLMTPIFALARMAGWTAHVREQYADNQMIRPGSRVRRPARPDVRPDRGARLARSTRHASGRGKQPGRLHEPRVTVVVAHPHQVDAARRPRSSRMPCTSVDRELAGRPPRRRRRRPRAPAIMAGGTRDAGQLVVHEPRLLRAAQRHHADEHRARARRAPARASAPPRRRAPRRRTRSGSITKSAPASSFASSLAGS